MVEVLVPAGLRPGRYCHRFSRLPKDWWLNQPQVLALVQFTRISNAMDFNYSVRLTLILSKITLVVTTMPYFVYWPLPASFYS